MEEKDYKDITVEDFKLLSENEKIDAFKQVLKNRDLYKKWWLDESVENAKLNTLLNSITVVLNAGFDIKKVQK